MLIQGLAGQQNNADLAVQAAMRIGKQGELMASELHARYYEQTYRGKRFKAASQAVATTTAGLALTYTGLCIANPITSQVNAVLDKASVMQSVLQATQVEAFAIATGFNATTNITNTTSLAVRSSLTGGNPGSVVASISATLPTAPFYDLFVQNTATATANGPANVVDIEGAIILPPGGYALWVTPAQASVAGMWFSFSWEEVPI